MINRKLLNNKKGFSMSGWIETALFSAMFILLVVSLFVILNKDFDSDLGDTGPLGDIANSTKIGIMGYEDTLQTSVAGGESSSTGTGISLSTTWSIISAGSKLIWDFLTGRWIEVLGGMVGLPSVVWTILRILFVISVGLVILRLVLKIKP